MSLSKSEQMSRVRTRDTSPERALRSALWARGYRYRTQWKTPAGRADFAFVRPKVAIFVDGCFWHGCPDHYSRPKTKADFWAQKLYDNVERDRRQTAQLEALGWTVVRVWEHEIEMDIDRVIRRVIGILKSGADSRTEDWRVVRVEASGDTEIRFLETLRNPETSRKMEGPRITGRTASRRNK